MGTHNAEVFSTMLHSGAVSGCLGIRLHLKTIDLKPLYAPS